MTRSRAPVILAALWPLAAAVVHAAPDEASLKADYEKFVRALDHARVAEDYAKAVRNLQSDDRERQRVGLATLAATEEPAVIPWIVPLLGSPHPDVRLGAGLALARLVEAHALKRRDPAVGDRVALRPRGPKDPDLRPLAWAVWTMLRQPDDGSTHAYAASMVRYLELPAFAGDLRGLLQSRHPAVRDAARSALEGFGLPAAPAPPPDKPARPKEPAPSKVVVEKTTITFDPKTCTEGRGKFFWGLGSCAVKVLGHEGGHCVFEYTQEVEMGVTVYLVRVPADAGPVVIKIDRVTQDGSTYPWPVTSFPLDKAKVVRRGGGRGVWEVRVGDTDSFVTVHPAERRSEMVPRTGEAVRFRFELFDGPAFKDRLAGAAFRPAAEFVAGSDEVWPWLRIAAEGMAVGDRVRAEVPVKVAEGAAAWLPKGSHATVLYLEVSLVSAGRGK